MNVYYCDSCGKRVSGEDVAGGRAFEIDGQVYCKECAAAQMPEVTAVPVESIPSGPVHCSRCKTLIPPEDLGSGKALSAQGLAYCVKCVRLYRPLLEGLINKEQEKGAGRLRRRAPTKGARLQPQEYRGEVRAVPVEYEKKSNSLIIVAIVACVVVLIIVLAVALSSSSKDPRQKPPIDAIDEPGPDERPPIVFPDDRPELPRFTEDDSVNQAIANAEAFARKNPEAYDAIIARFEQIAHQSLSAGQTDLVRGVINNTREKRKHAAQKVSRKLLEEADVLEDKGDYTAAKAALEKYPVNLRPVHECWSEVQGRISYLEKKIREKEASPKEPFEELMKEVEELMLLQKEQEAIAKLEEFKKEHPGSPFITEAEELIGELRKTIEEREATTVKEEEEKEEEKEKEKEEETVEKEIEEEETIDALEVVRTSEPLYYADFTGENLSANIDVKFKGCKYWLEVTLKKHTLCFLEPKATATLEFPLSEKPKRALLRLHHTLLSATGRGDHTVVTLALNGAAIVEGKRYAEGEALSEVEFDVSDMLVKGKNKLILTQAGGNLRWGVRKVELRADYDGEGWAKEKVAAEKRKKEAEGRFKKWTAGSRKEVEKKRSRAARKFQRNALRALKPGKEYPLFNGKDLKGWKAWGKGGEWTVEKGELVGRNNSLDWSLIFTPDYKEQENWQDYTWTVKCVFENSCASKWGARACYPKEKEGEPPIDVGLQFKPGNVPLNKDVEFKFVVKGNSFIAYFDGNEVSRNDQITPAFEKGFVSTQLGPNATIRIKEMKLKLDR